TCSRPHADPPAATPLALDAHRTLTAPVVAGNLTVWPVVTDAPADMGEFVTLEEAQARGVATVREVGAEGGASDPSAPAASAAGARDGDEEDDFADVESGDDVNALVVENKGDAPILVCAGTLLQGGNQDRQVGDDVVIA